MVIADHLPVKACMTRVKPGMVVEPVLGLPTEVIWYLTSDSILEKSVSTRRAS